MANAAPLISVQVMGQRLASRGPVWDNGAEIRSKIAALRLSDMRLINAETPQDAVFHTAGFRKLTTQAHIAELNLCASEAMREAAMGSKWRNRWRRAKAAPFAVDQSQFNATKHEWLLEADLAQQKQKRFRSLPHTLLKAIATHEPQSVTVFTASDAGRPRAAMLFVQHWPVVTYHLGWLCPKARKWSLHHHILMQAADEFARAGYKRLDLGGVDTEQAPGLARFKIGSGARVRPLGGTWLRLGRIK